MNICIINDTDAKINYNSLEKGCGGSETWALQLAQAFVNRGHIVNIFTTTDEIAPDKLFYNKFNIIPINEISKYWNNIKYDFIIVSRVLLYGMYKFLKNNCINEYIFYQFHDLYPLEDYYKTTGNFVNKIVALTPFHAKFLHEETDIDYSRFTIISNAVDLTLFNNINVNNRQRDNRILWCSNPDRGLYIILDYLYDDIKKEIPDFGIDICYPNYASLDLTYIKDKDVKILGSLSKTDLYKEMIKHKCWCYPQNFIDTFCISMLEQAICNVNIVCPWWYAPGDIFGDLNSNNRYNTLLDKQTAHLKTFLNNKLYTDSDNFAKYLKWLKEQIIDAIKNYDSEENKIKRHNMFIRVIQNYDWNNIAQLYETLYINEKVQHGDC